MYSAAHYYGSTQSIFGGYLLALWHVQFILHIMCLIISGRKSTVRGESGICMKRIWYSDLFHPLSFVCSLRVVQAFQRKPFAELYFMQQPPRVAQWKPEYDSQLRLDSFQFL